MLLQVLSAYVSHYGTGILRSWQLHLLPSEYPFNLARFLSDSSLMPVWTFSWGKLHVPQWFRDECSTVYRAFKMITPKPTTGVSTREGHGRWGLRGLLSPWCVFLPLADALLEQRLTDGNSSPTHNLFQAPDTTVSSRLPALPLLRAILPERTHPFFSSSTRIYKDLLFQR